MQLGLGSHWEDITGLHSELSEKAKLLHSLSCGAKSLDIGLMFTPFTFGVVILLLPSICKRSVFETTRSCKTTF